MMIRINLFYLCTYLTAERTLRSTSKDEYKQLICMSCFGDLDDNKNSVRTVAPLSTTKLPGVKKAAGA
jgi:hypothetical protein